MTVRVLGFDESALISVPHPDQLGRLDVALIRRPGQRVLVCAADGAPLGELPTRWSRIIGDELRMCEREDVTAVARATLTGPHGDRDLCVLLAWPRRDMGA